MQSIEESLKDYTSEELLSGENIVKKYSYFITYYLKKYDTEDARYEK